LGLHPMAVAEHNEQSLVALEPHLQRRHHKVVAIGETGLDLFIEHPQFERQQALLDAQLRLARDYSLPVILHSRLTHDKLVQQLRRID
ncbi:TatD family hydrolase, partial [Erwinia amylovora]|uniref:TatD family hydrolase n=1 Tax=Erwinia amylovora TaxID=552 RepID=UPI00200A2034